MKTRLLPLAAAALCAAGSVSGADPVVPPPPAANEPAKTTPSARPADSGRTGRVAAMAEHLPLLGLIKQVEERGKVTREEFLAHAKKQAEEAFAKLDKNSDGAIDKAEVAGLEDRLKGAREKLQQRGRTGPRQRPGADTKPAN